MEPNNEQIPQKNAISNISIISFILSLMGVLVAGIPCGIAAVVTGIIGITKFKNDSQIDHIKAVIRLILAILGIIIGLIDAILVAIALPIIMQNLGV